MGRLQRKIEIKENAIKRSNLSLVVSDELVDNYINSQINKYEFEAEEDLQLKLLDKYPFEDDYYEEIITLIKRESPSAIIEMLQNEFDESYKDSLFDMCKESVINNIIKPFGIANIISQSDKNGGNVTTLHNFDKQAQMIKDGECNIKMVAKDTDYYNAHRYVESNQKFDRREYEGQDFKNKRKEYIKQTGDLIDGYTGKVLNKDGRAHLDHIVSAKEINEDSRNHLFMSPEQRNKMAIDDKNLCMTDGSINQSKGAKSMGTFLYKENKDGRTNLDRFDIDEDKAVSADKEARKHIKNTQLNYQIKKQGTEIAITSANEGVKLGAQQTLGLILKDFTELTFFEIKEFIKVDFISIKNPNLHKLSERIKKVTKDIISRWKHYIHIFKEGFISGILSNIFTFIINNFITTLKNINRIIREGFFSLIKAIKMVVHPAAGMTRNEAKQEAIKLIASSIIVSLGILSEEAISKVMGNLPFGRLLTSVTVGMLTGIATCIVTYLIDKADFFNVNADKKYEFIMDRLQEYEDYIVLKSKYYTEMALID